MVGRRTRAATATKLIANGGNNLTSVENAFALNDLASPKRKDSRLDVNDMKGTIIELVETSTNGMNGKRNQRNGKRQMQPITNFFHSNGLNEINLQNSNEFPALPDAKIAQINGIHLNGNKTDEKYDILNLSNEKEEEILSIPPAPKQSNYESKQNQAQTTPHRIVAISPTKKQRLYEKSMAVFSNLNIGNEPGSPQIKIKTPKKRPNQRTRRKLMVNGPEHSVQTIVKLDNENNLYEESKEKVEFKEPVAPPKQVHETQLTDYFPIRRSIRKTKKAVEEENEHHIQMAIEKQLENGLVVKEFEGKGRGIIAGKDFKRGEFVVEYIGDLIEQNEADRREEEYAKDINFGCYMYYFKHKEQQWW